MAKSIYLQTAAEYRSLAENARSEEQRLLLLTFASEWEALAEAAASRSKHRADISAPQSSRALIHALGLPADFRSSSVIA